MSRAYEPRTLVDRKRFAAMLRAIRAYFDGQGFDEVLTPNLVAAGAIESTIDVPSVTGPNGGAWGVLHSSPEIAMKAAIARAPGSTYQIARCYRDDPDTGIHFREFTMLEWYRLPGGYRDVLADFWKVVTAVRGRLPAYDEVCVRDIVKKTAGIDIRHDTLPGPETESWEDRFFRLIVDHVEPALPADRWTVLRDYPSAVSPLSAPCAGDPFFAERFEVYAGKVELCNGCTELADTAELDRRWHAENEKRQAAGTPPHARPQGLFDAAEAGLPRYAGVAVGLERLFQV